MYWRLEFEPQTRRAAPRGFSCLYSPSCREEEFSETELPVWGVLGNSKAKKHRKRAGV